MLLDANYVRLIFFYELLDVYQVGRETLGIQGYYFYILPCVRLISSKKLSAIGWLLEDLGGEGRLGCLG